MNEPSYTTNYLIPEYKEVDYIIKIEGELTEADTNVLESVTNIPGMIAAYSLETNKLKSKKNLIF
jgi:nitrate reductase NapAB chaperone NapD